MKQLKVISIKSNVLRTFVTLKEKKGMLVKSEQPIFLAGASK